MAQKKHKAGEIVATPSGRGVGIAGMAGSRSDPDDRGDGLHLISLAQGFGGLKRGSVTRLKECEKENERLRKAAADLTLDKLILKGAASANI